VLTAPEVIKLDRSIVAGAADDPVLRTLVRSLVAFGHGSGSVVVAEGIETEQDAVVLTELGVDYGQGWYFGRPGPPEALDPVGESLPPVGESLSPAAGSASVPVQRSARITTT